MKKNPLFILCLLFVLLPTLLKAQDNPLQVKLPTVETSTPFSCGTPPMTEAQRRYTLDVVDRAGADRNAGTTCIPIRIHIVNQDDGTGGISLGDVNIGMSYLNAVYLTAGIEFYIAAVNNINSTAWYDFQSSEEAALRAAHLVDDAINIFFVKDITTSNGGACGYAYYPWNNDQSLCVMMDNDCTTGFENGTLVHELGHFFNLQHTHDGTENGNTHSDAEHVPRTGANANCTTDGDMICDTDADPRGNVDASCNYVHDPAHGDPADIFGNTYTPPVDNIMSYYSDACGGIFTPDQYTRIANGLATRLVHGAYDLDGAPPMVVADPSGMAAVTNSSYGIDLSWIDNAGNETGYLLEKSTDGGTTWIPISGAGLGPNVTTYTDTDINSNTTYDYRVKASNDDCNAYSNAANITTGLLYCTPTHQSNSCAQSGIGVAIHNFTFSDGGATLINNPANGCNGALSIFTPTHFANVVVSGTYTFTANFQLNTPPSGSFFNQFVTVWVDLDQSGSFESSEMLFQSTAAAGPTVTGAITIPATALNGNTTLRIRSGWNGGGAISDPCDNHSFSEAEDYGLIIGGALPVDLISFTGKKETDLVQLDWATASEENNDYFIIEKSLNGVDFEFLTKQQGRGTTQEINTYESVDRQPANGINYYRLTQVDFDGTQHVEERMVAIEFVKGASVSVVPNPVKTEIVSINYLTEQGGQVAIGIYDVNGRMIHQSVATADKGQNQFELSMPDLSNGVYFIRTSKAGDLQTVRFVKTK